LKPVLLSAMLLAALLQLARPDAAPPKRPNGATGVPSVAATVGSILIDRYDLLEWMPETNHFHSPGPVRLSFVDPITNEATVLTADDAEGSPTEKVVVHGRLLMVRPEGWLTGRSLTYQPGAQTGSVLDAQADLKGCAISGARIDMLGSRAIRATQAMLTTCSAQHPDYRITAREISFSQNGTVKARDVSFWAGRTRVFVLPYLTKSFSRTVSTPFPLPTYTKDGGPQIHLGHEAIDDPGMLLTYDLVLAMRKPLQGSVIFERDLGRPSATMAAPRTRPEALYYPQRSVLAAHPALLREAEIQEIGPPRTSAYVLASANMFTYNPRRTDLQVSRSPEAGFVLQNMLGHRSASGSGVDRADSSMKATDWLLNLECGIGSIHERPTDRTSSRVALHSEAVSPLMTLAGPLRIRWGGSVWANGYGTGEGYGLIAPEGELEYLLRPNTIIGTGYRYMLATGTTPFEFDARSIRHELRVWYGFIGAHWGYSLSLAGDLDHRSVYDTAVSIRRRFDCMEIGVSYKTRAQMLGLILNLLPGKSSPPPTGIANP
jgi:hypothetical protein